MESFSLLKYWRGGGGATVAAAIRSSAANHGTDVATAVPRPSSATTDDGGEGEDEGPFFDLEFGAADGAVSKSGIEVEEGEFDIELKGAGGGENLRAEGSSSSDDLFFKGKLVPLEPSSIAVADEKPQCESSISLLKLAPKFRVFSLGYRKFKPAAAEPNAAAHPAAASPKQQPQQQQQQSKFFARDRRARSSSTNRPSKTAADANTTATVQAAAAAAEADEKRFAREVLQKYRNMIKPLYVRASKKHMEKHKVSGASSEAEPPEEEAPAKDAGGGRSLPAGMKASGKRLGKSWQTSAAVAAVPSPPPPPPPQRRDDSLLELQDGIQNAIAHCKRSFTAPDKGSAESPLARSKSEPIQATVDSPA